VIGLEEKAQKVKKADGLIAILAAKIKKQVARNVVLAEDQPEKREQDIHLVVQHRALVVKKEITAKNQRLAKRDSDMKITKEELQQIIKEEVEQVLSEQELYMEDATYEDGAPVDEEFGFYETLDESIIEEAEYRGRKVKLNKPMRGDVKKFKVYVRDPKTGNIKKVNFGHGGTSAKRKGEKTMRIRKSNPKARRNFRKRHNCKNPGPKTKARYWSCRKW
jgi:hypothetical protein